MMSRKKENNICISIIVIVVILAFFIFLKRCPNFYYNNIFDCGFTLSATHKQQPIPDLLLDKTKVNPRGYCQHRNQDMQKQQITLEISWEEGEYSAPQDWNWEDILDIGPNESFKIVSFSPVENIPAVTDPLDVELEPEEVEEEE